MEPWEFVRVADQTWYEWHLDGALVQIGRDGREWHWRAQDRKTSEIRRDFSGPTRVDGQASDSDRRVYFDQDTIALRPLTLDRPFVVVPQVMIDIHPGHAAAFTIDLPVSYHWVGVDGTELARPNTIQLTKTWFGDGSSGEACFLWKTDLKPLESQPFGSLARVPIRIHNQGKSVLNLRQFAVYTRVLSLWVVDRCLQTGPVIVEGMADGSLRMTTDENVPRGAQLLQKAPVDTTELLIQKGVSFLRNIAGIS